MDRRGFFAAVLAPLVVPWKAKPCCQGLMDQLDLIGKRLPAHRLADLQTAMNRHYNLMYDNIILSRR